MKKRIIIPLIFMSTIAGAYALEVNQIIDNTRMFIKTILLTDDGTTSGNTTIILSGEDGSITMSGALNIQEGALKDRTVVNADLVDDAIDSRVIKNGSIKQEDLDPSIDFGNGKFKDGVNPDDAVYTGRNVGIGTTTPRAKLEIKTTDYNKPIFMAGYNVNNGITPGSGSIAMGNSTIASGDYSMAMGNNTQANGQSSTAMGVGTQANGYSSISMGYSTIASGDYSFAEGYYSQANGNYSTAMGYWTKANGNYSIAMGRYTQVNGSSSTAMGYSTQANGESSVSMGNRTQANGDSSTAMGYSNQANGTYSTAMGYSTQANGGTSVSMGNRTQANGNSSTAIGYSTQANGTYSISMGYSTQANGVSSIVMGNSTIASTDYSLILGRYGQTASDDLFAVAYGRYGDQNTAGAGLVFKVKKNGDVYADGSFNSNGADYAEYFEADNLNELKVGDLVGFNEKTGKVRKYRAGDEFIGIVSNNPSVVGNLNGKNEEEQKKWKESHVLVGLLGQLDFDKEQVKIKGRRVYTIDGKKIGLLLSNGKILIK